MLSYLTDFLDGLDRRPKLLVVDDQPINIRAIHALFKAECEVLMATKGEDAVQVCAEQQPDLVLLDIVMPGIDGYEVCRRIKADPATEHVPVIFLTGQDDEETEERGFEVGAVDFISKPIRNRIVRARVFTHLARKIQSDKLRNLAMTDGLTGVANRRRFDETLAMHQSQCARYQKPLSVILIDVDFFKRYNDHYGHLQGDACLKDIAEALQHIARRPHDLLARYGGEEFACVLPYTNSDGAKKVAQEMLESVRALASENVASDISEFVTVSIGVATSCPKPCDSTDELVAVADEMLYRSKKAGRDQLSATYISSP